LSTLKGEQCCLKKILKVQLIFFPLAGLIRRVSYEQKNLSYQQMEKKQAGEG